MCVQEYSLRTTNGWKGEAETQRNTRNTIGNTSFLTSSALFMSPKRVCWNWNNVSYHHPPYGFMATSDCRNRDLRLPPSRKTNDTIGKISKGRIWKWCICGGFAKHEGKPSSQTHELNKVTNCGSVGSYSLPFNLSNRLTTSHDLAIGGCRVVTLGRGWLGLKGGEDRKWKSRHAVHHAMATSTDPSDMMLVGKGWKRRIEWCVFGANRRSFVNGKGAKCVLKWERDGVELGGVWGLGLLWCAAHCESLTEWLTDLVTWLVNWLVKVDDNPPYLLGLGSVWEMESWGHPPSELP